MKKDSKKRAPKVSTGKVEEIIDRDSKQKKLSKLDLKKKLEKNLNLVLLVVALFIGGALIYANSGNGNNEAADQSLVAGSGYLEYSEKAFESASKDTRLLFFHASWCSQCQALDASILESEIPSGVKIFKVDYDSHQDLKKKYKVTLQATFIKVDESGAEVDRYNAYKQPSFDLVKRSLLKE